MRRATQRTDRSSGILMAAHRVARPMRGRPRRVLLVPDEHGRGHLARQAVLAHALLERGTEVCGTPALARVVRDRFGLPIEAFGGHPPLDLGHTLWDAFRAGDLDATMGEVREGAPARVAAWQRWLSGAGADVVVSDADPFVLTAALWLGARAWLVSNFTWSDFLAGWAGPEAAAWLDGLYGAAAGALELPLSTGLRGVRASPRAAVPHLAIPDPAARARPPPGPGEPLRVLWAMSGGDPAIPRRVTGAEPFELWVAEDAAAMPTPEGPGTLRTFTGLLASMMARVDLVATKCGYSTTAEAIAAERPLLELVRPRAAEDEAIAMHLRAVGVAESLTLGEADLVTLPDRPAVAAMHDAYAAKHPSLRCEPRAVADAVLACAARR